MTGAGDRLEPRLDAQARASAEALAAAVSAGDLVHHRPAFGWTVVPGRGSVLASRALARWDPAPDYAYHWLRDAAVAMISAAGLAKRASGEAGDVWERRFAEYVAFSLATLDRPLPRTNPLAATTAPEAERFLRPDDELAALDAGERGGEPRWNADGSPDLERWSRPQHDGPALRLLSCLAWADGPALAGPLLARDAAYTLAHAAEPCIGPWEEEGEEDLHAFTLMAQRAALAAARSAGLVEAETADAALARVEAALDALAQGTEGRLRARAGVTQGDAAVILGALLDPEADLGAERFGIADPRVLATLRWLLDWSAGAFAINEGASAPLVGRSPADRYFGGNPWLPTTLGVAELHHRLAARGDAGRAVAVLVPDAAAGDPRAVARALFARGDAFLARVLDHAGPAGALPEQVDAATGSATGCPDLVWSHAAFLAACEARREAVSRLA